MMEWAIARWRELGHCQPASVLLSDAPQFDWGLAGELIRRVLSGARWPSR